MACQWYNPASYGTCANDVARSAAGDAFHSITESFGQAADHAVSWLWLQVNSASAVHLGGQGFDLELEITAAIAGVIAVGLFSVQIIQSVLRREPGGLGRALKGMVVAFIGGGLAIAVVDLLLGATDSLCVGVVKAAAGTNVAGLGKLILGGGALTSSVNGSAALLLLSLGCIVATVSSSCALVVRKVLIVVTAIFAPRRLRRLARRHHGLLDPSVDRDDHRPRGLEADPRAHLRRRLRHPHRRRRPVRLRSQPEGHPGHLRDPGALRRRVRPVDGAQARPLHGEHAHQLHSLGSSAVGGVSPAGAWRQKAAP